MPERSVRAAAEITIHAPVEAVWATFTAFDSWPQWSPGVKTMRVYGPLAVGTTFRWKVELATITSTIVEVDPPHAITWTGRAIGVAAKHQWEFAEVDGQTAVRTDELWYGIVPTLLRRQSQRVLQTALNDVVAALKRRVEAHRAEQG